MPRGIGRPHLPETQMADVQAAAHPFRIVQGLERFHKQRGFNPGGIFHKERRTVRDGLSLAPIARSAAR